MLSKADVKKRSDRDSSGSQKLLREIDAINDAICPRPTKPVTSISTHNYTSKILGKTMSPDPIQPNPPRRVGQQQQQHHQQQELNRDTKSPSFWNWKHSRRAFSHVRSRRFNCSFSLLVHSIHGLPPTLNGVSLRVHWKRRDGELLTRTARILQGTAIFEQKLTHVCSVYGSTSGPHHSAKYEAKHFLLFPSILSAPELDLGKHRVDLTRFLPITLGELNEEKRSGKWATSFKLSGKASGAVMNVSFEYLVMGDNMVAKSPEVLRPMPDDRHVTRRSGSLKASNASQISSDLAQSDVKFVHEVLSVPRLVLSSSVNLLHEKLDAPVDCKPELDVFTVGFEPIQPMKESSPDLGNDKSENVYVVNSEFSVIEHGVDEVELPYRSQVKSADVSLRAVVEDRDGMGLPSREWVKYDEVTVKACQGCSIGTSVAICEEENELPLQIREGRSFGDKLVTGECSSKEDICTTELLMKEPESALNTVLNLEDAGLESPEDQENCLCRVSSFKITESLNDVTESVATEFLNMMEMEEHSLIGSNFESEPESPRERLLRQFEKDILDSGCDLFDFGISDEDQVELSQDAPTCSGRGSSSGDFETFVQDAAEEHLIAAQTQPRKTRAEILENLEAEAVMSEWGLYEKAFQCSSPPNSSIGSGSLINIPPEVPLQFSPLDDGLGAFVETENGGFLRSMNPALFRRAKSGGSLIMQVSRPVVVPAEMGSGTTDVSQDLALVGIEKLSMPAYKLMPLQDITGSTMQQMAWEAAPSLQPPEKFTSLAIAHQNLNNSTSVEKQLDSEFVSLEELAPLAMDKIGALSIGGLKIQSGISDEDVPLNVNSQSIMEISSPESKRTNSRCSSGLEGAAGFQLLDIKASGDDSIDGLIGLSMTLDEWMRLDAGEIDDEISDRTSKILAAHHATDLTCGGLKVQKEIGKSSKNKCGLLGNNFTVALMVQLRNPQQNNEPVGTAMLALIQVERVFVTQKPKVYRTVPGSWISKEGNSELAAKDKREETKEEKSLEKGIVQFKINEVHVVGVKTEVGNKKKLWGTTTQQQSGSRWLLANGMGKNNKRPLMKPKAANGLSGNTLWSISGQKSHKLAAQKP